MVQSPELKFILMSATLKADRFSLYYNNCNTNHIPGTDAHYLPQHTPSTYQVLIHTIYPTTHHPHPSSLLVYVGQSGYNRIVRRVSSYIMMISCVFQDTLSLSTSFSKPGKYHTPNPKILYHKPHKVLFLFFRCKSPILSQSVNALRGGDKSSLGSRRDRGGAKDPVD